MTNNNNSHSFRNPRLGLGLRRILLTSASAALMLMAAGQRAEAAPLFYSLEAGDASVTVNGTTTRIDQTSDRAVINWTSFNVSAAETVTFQVPSSDGATLNRIVGGASSTISGTINSNGTVFFVNPNGLVFNGTTQQAINVGSFIAYTGAVDTNDFMRQQPLFMETPTSSTTPSISISTQINIPSGGFVGLYGPQVSVSGRVTIAGGSMEVVSYNRNLTLGMVTNKGGEVRLTSGGNITLNGVLDLASGVLSLVSTAPSSRVSTSGNDGNGTISNTSDVIADRVSITSSGQGSVSLNNVHIARLGEVNLSTPQGDKLFSLTNRRDLTVDGAITLYGALVLRTVDSTSFGITISSAITVNQIQSAASNPTPEAWLRPGTSPELRCDLRRGWMASRSMASSQLSAA